MLGEGEARRPTLFASGMRVIADCAKLDIEVGMLFVQMLGEAPKSGAAIFVSLIGTTARRAAMSAVAGVALQDDERELFDALQLRYAAAQRKRNPMAHWVWGYVESWPERILLADPTRSIRNSALYEQFNPTGVREETVPDFPYSADGVLVYSREDFLRIRREISELKGLYARFSLFLKTRRGLVIPGYEITPDEQHDGLRASLHLDTAAARPPRRPKTARAGRPPRPPAPRTPAAEIQDDQ